MKKQHETILGNLFEKYSGENILNITELPESGSYRKYYRINGSKTCVLGTFNKDIKENKAYFAFTDTFRRNNLAVPEIFLTDETLQYYLQQDLGDVTLFGYLTDERNIKGFSENIITVYKHVISDLPEFQIKASNDIDYSVCYPRNSFDKQSMLWDLSYFKYYFLKLARISFDEQNLEDDFQAFCNYLLTTDCNHFLYRDFQSRNIMLYNEKPYYIDFQGGRKGALQYDIASLLYDAKADIPQEIRTLLLEHYIEELKKYISVDKKTFIEYYYGYVLIRIMQAMGAYGFRGFYEKKSHFLQSIPYALNNLRWIIDNINIPVKLPSLYSVFDQLINTEELYSYGKASPRLHILITSFSYKKGVPADPSGNGGGFVFDCRALNNPGRYEDYKILTGKDDEVKLFLEKFPDTEQFFENTSKLVCQSVENYLLRGFSNLMVNYGCTGGQHRSVYFAERLSDFLKKKYDVRVTLHHREQN